MQCRPSVPQHHHRRCHHRSLHLRWIRWHHLRLQVRRSFCHPQPNQLLIGQQGCCSLRRQPRWSPRCCRLLLVSCSPPFANRLSRQYESPEHGRNSGIHDGGKAFGKWRGMEWLLFRGLMVFFALLYGVFSTSSHDTAQGVASYSCNCLCGFEGLREDPIPQSVRSSGVSSLMVFLFNNSSDSGSSRL